MTISETTNRKPRRRNWWGANLKAAKAVSRAHSGAYYALVKAMKRRSAEGMTVTALAQELGRDKGQVSRVLNGNTGGMGLDTLAAYLSVLRHDLSIDAIPHEERALHNWDARNMTLIEEAPSTTAHYLSLVSSDEDAAPLPRTRGTQYRIRRSAA